MDGLVALLAERGRHGCCASRQVARHCRRATTWSGGGAETLLARAERLLLVARRADYGRAQR